MDVGGVEEKLLPAAGGLAVDGNSDVEDTTREARMSNQGSKTSHALPSHIGRIKERLLPAGGIAVDGDSNMEDAAKGEGRGLGCRAGLSLVDTSVT